MKTDFIHSAMIGSQTLTPGFQGCDVYCRNMRQFSSEISPFLQVNIIHFYSFSNKLEYLSFGLKKPLKTQQSFQNMNITIL